MNCSIDIPGTEPTAAASARKQHSASSAFRDRQRSFELDRIRAYTDLPGDRFAFSLHAEQTCEHRPCHSEPRTASEKESVAPRNCLLLGDTPVCRWLNRSRAGALNVSPKGRSIDSFAGGYGVPDAFRHGGCIGGDVKVRSDGAPRRQRTRKSSEFPGKRATSGENVIGNRMD